jgi:hypothetical protein
VPPATTSIPGAVWDKSQWTVTIVGLDDPNDPNGPDSRRNVKNVDFGNQQVVALPGDFNLNGVVDAADSTIWRDTLGRNVTPYTGADGDGSGIIDQADYLVWKSNFGNSLPASAAAVEEPVALATTFEASASSGSGAAIEQFAVSSAPALAEPVAQVTALAEPVVHARFAADGPARMAVRTSPIAARADAALLAWLTGLSDSIADRMAGGDAAAADWDFNEEPVDDDSATVLATALDRAFAKFDA